LPSSNLPRKPLSYTTCTDERELLTNVWATIAKYQQYVSYNGKGFDYPFLLFRSLVHKVTIAKGLESTRHLDLAKLLRPNNSQYKLSAICEALGIDDPKSHGVSGLYVSQLYRQNKYQEIVDYVARRDLYHCPISGTRARCTTPLGQSKIIE